MYCAFWSIYESLLLRGLFRSNQLPKGMEVSWNDMEVSALEWDDMYGSIHLQQVDMEPHRCHEWRHPTNVNIRIWNLRASLCENDSHDATCVVCWKNCVQSHPFTFWAKKKSPRKNVQPQYQLKQNGPVQYIQRLTVGHRESRYSRYNLYIYYPKLVEHFLCLRN